MDFGHFISIDFFKLKFQKTPQSQELLIEKANSSSEVLKLSHWLSVPGVRAPEFKFPASWFVILAKLVNFYAI